MKILSAVKYITDRDYRWKVNDSHGRYDAMPDEAYLKRKFRLKLGYEPDLEHPRTFNEKLQWLKLHDRKPAYTVMVDKYAVKDYVAERIGKEYVIPTIGVWDRAEDVPFDSLPDRFVLKCTHDSHGLVICRDKKTLDVPAAVKKLDRALDTDYYLRFREWPYKHVKPRIIAEEYMEDESGAGLRDYKVLCFGGEPKLIELHQDRFTDHSSQDFYDTDWKLQTISQSGVEKYRRTAEPFPRPEKLEEMLALSRRLAQGIPHVRADWYIVRGQLYFGELTFFDGSGFVPFDDPRDDEMLGSWITLPEKTDAD